MKFAPIKIWIPFLFVLMLSLNHCEHDQSFTTACGIENPIENIFWLKNAINENKNYASVTVLSIDLYNYNSDEIILMKWQQPGSFDLPSGAVYDCQGNKLYSCGGSQPIDSCSYILQKAEFVINLWKKD